MVLHVSLFFVFALAERKNEKQRNVKYLAAADSTRVSQEIVKIGR